MSIAINATNMYDVRREIVERERKREGENVTSWWNGFMVGVFAALIMWAIGCAVSHEQKTSVTPPTPPWMKVK